MKTKTWITISIVASFVSFGAIFTMRDYSLRMAVIVAAFTVQVMASYHLGVAIGRGYGTTSKEVSDDNVA